MTNPQQAIMDFLQVLVHGAWVDGSGWNGVYDILVKNGYTSASSKSLWLWIEME
jgi:hypothetical protein